MVEFIMKILMASSEAEPYAKSGGLADVVSSLSQSLTEQGHDIRVILPHYRDMIFNRMEMLPGRCAVSWGVSEETSFQIIRDRLRDVPYYFISHPLMSERAGIYGDTSFSPYPDNNRRFALFQHGIFYALTFLDWTPDVIHCHDWTTGLVPYLLNTHYRKEFPQTSSVMTIHNLAYQGKYPRLDLHTFGITPDIVAEEGDINLLRTGICSADWVTTVSPTYAGEVQTPEYGYGLDSLLRSRHTQFSGIINGVDYTEWNPESDSLIPARYGMENLEVKAANKSELQGISALAIREDVPVISMVSRIAEQKGFIELLSNGTSALEEILRQLPVQVVIIGTGEEALEQSLRELAGAYENLSVLITFQNKLAHLAEAGADFFLMPSRYEPCGLNQIYSLKYGTLPIVRQTGGLADTVTDISFEGGTGIVFKELSSENIFEAVRRAVYFWLEQKEAYREAQIRGMKQDFSWKKSAQEYESVYNRIRRPL